MFVNGDPNPGRPDLAPYGAGECGHKPLIAAIANAVYDATGVRLRRAPFRSDRVLSALRVLRMRSRCLSDDRVTVQLMVEHAGCRINPSAIAEKKDFALR